MWVWLHSILYTVNGEDAELFNLLYDAVNDFSAYFFIFVINTL